MVLSTYRTFKWFCMLKDLDLLWEIEGEDLAVKCNFSWSPRIKKYCSQRHPAYPSWVPHAAWGRQSSRTGSLGQVPHIGMLTACKVHCWGKFLEKDKKRPQRYWDFLIDFSTANHYGNGDHLRNLLVDPKQSFVYPVLSSHFGAAILDQLTQKFSVDSEQLPKSPVSVVNENRLWKL